jgi:hypothetical protein
MSGRSDWRLGVDRRAPMVERRFHWRRINKHEARELQSFTCTVDWPRTPGGRREPEHPRPWEWQAQRHLRLLTQHLREGDIALVGCDEEGFAGAALHLSCAASGGLLVVEVKVGAVSMRYRHQRGLFLGDELVDVARATAIDEARRIGASALSSLGYIHERNLASSYMAMRAGAEPQGMPDERGYQVWRCDADVPPCG